MIASEMASRHQPINWRDSIGFQTSVTQEAFPKRESSRRVSFPIQRTRVTRVTRDVLCLFVFHDCVSVSPLMGRNVLAAGCKQKIRTVVQSDGHKPCMSIASLSPKLCLNGGLHREGQWPLCHHPHVLHLGVMVMIHLLLFLLILIKFLDSFKINQVPF